ncbi:hypothetical protein AVEN_218354-1 [Araneus ventricosus]|uniref:Uncharacterized protein n=1 Tax=Araneus ventricosus TaxID=182803 RepID=A0A4Y2THL2_ARAVE|nr:hypothetical protein AVEN_218354-1 [Araneus ventricosus]
MGLQQCWESEWTIPKVAQSDSLIREKLTASAQSDGHACRRTVHTHIYGSYIVWMREWSYGMRSLLNGSQRHVTWLVSK